MKTNEMLKTEQNYWLDITVWLVVCFLVFQGVAVADTVSKGLPRKTDYDRFAKISDCTVYRSVLKDSQFKLKEQELALNDVLELTQASRRDFEVCAKANGVTKLETEQQEVEGAFFCLDHYEQWLRRGISLEMVRQDVKTAMSDVHQLLGHLTSACPSVTLASNP